MWRKTASRLSRVCGGAQPAHTIHRLFTFEIPDHGGEREWVQIQEARLPVLRNRLHAFIVPGGSDASFRQPATGQLLRARVTQVLGLLER